MRFFNTAGPNALEIHYTLSERSEVADLRRLIERRQYFLLHAPRQTGKSTAMLQLGRQLTAEGRYAAAMLSVEVGAPFGDDVATAEGAILEAFRRQARERLPEDLRPPPWPAAQEGSRVLAALAAWSRACPRPLVLFIDEIDSLRDDALITVLRQLRDGYPDRPGGFPHSVGLVGLRDVRDYRYSTGDAGRLGSASPFNIKARSLRMGDFTQAEVLQLLGMHTEETEQRFSAEAGRRIWGLSRGQPWLVNALAAELVDELVPDRSQPIELAHVEQARERLVRRMDTHLDSLAARLREPRVRAVVEPILAGRPLEDVPPDDRRFVLDLGLVREGEAGLEVANPIYAQIIPSVLAVNARSSIPRLDPIWLDAQRRLLPERLLQAFLSFWARHAEPLLRSAPYHEIAPHLVLMAFLDRVANGGGRVEREYAIGSGRMDLCLIRGDVMVPMELKVWRPGEPDPLQEGLEQIDRYLSGLRQDSGWLVLFDRRPDAPRASERTGSAKVSTPGGRSVTVVRA